MALLSIGTDFAAAPLADLARLAELDRHDDALAALLAPLASGGAVLGAPGQGGARLDGIIVLSTCNRFEVYVDTPDSAAAADLLSRGIARRLHGTEAGAAAGLSVRHGDAAVTHLLAVASGLESMIAGDREITGQVKRALAAARRGGTTSAPLDRLFQFAAVVAKRVSARTRIEHSGRSVIETMLDLAATRAGSPNADAVGRRSALVIGTGAYARVVCAALARRGFTDIGVYSRSGRAAAFARDRGAHPVNEAELLGELTRTDLVVGASGAPGTVIDRALAARAADLRDPARRLVCADVALVRDIAPEAGELPGIEVLGLDDVRAIALTANARTTTAVPPVAPTAAPAEAAVAIAEARRIVDDATTEFAERERARRSDATIVALRSHLERIVEAEVDRVRRTAGAESAQAVARSLARVGNALLHTPTVHAKTYAAAGKHDEFACAVGALFDLEVPRDA